MGNGVIRMKYHAFKELLEKELSSYENFLIRALEFQKSRNKNRKPAKRWSEARVEKAAEEMWDDTVKKIYENVDSKVKRDTFRPEKPWYDFFEKYNFLEQIDEGLAEAEFE